MDTCEYLGGAGKDCCEALDRLVQRSAPRSINWPTEVRTRFTIWAREASLLDTGRQSLDYQLRKHAVLRASVGQFLAAIRADADLCGTQEQPEGHDHTQFEKLSNNDEDVMSRINDSIARLSRLSRQMRQHVRQKLDLEADSYEPPCPPGSNGESLSSKFLASLDWKMREHPQWRIGEVLKDRLRQTMLLRWRRISFYSAHVEPNAALSRSTRLESPAVGVAHDPSAPDTPVNVPGPSKEDGQPLQKKSEIGTAVPKSVMSAGVTIGPSFKPDHDRHSAVTSGGSRSLIGVQESDFPRPPRIEKGLTWFFCPLCGNRQPASKGKQKAWQYVWRYFITFKMLTSVQRKHVMRDLGPYICLFKQCATPTTVYHTKNEWIAHMDQSHQERAWSCQTCNEQCHSRRDFEKHLTEAEGHGIAAHLHSELSGVLTLSDNSRGS
jgi:hypothetical protein